MTDTEVIVTLAKRIAQLETDVRNMYDDGLKIARESDKKTEYLDNIREALGITNPDHELSGRVKARCK